MTGATALLTGKAGLVPTPAAGDEAKVLRGDGTWGVLNPGGSHSIQNALPSANITVDTWGSVVLIPTLSANVTITLPTVVGNTGRTITFVKVGVPNAFASVLATQSGETLSTYGGVNELTQQNGALTIEAVDTTTARQVSNIGNPGVLSEYGSQAVPNSSAAYTVGVYDIPSTSFVIPSAGRWEITYSLAIRSTALGIIDVYLSDASNTDIVPTGSRAAVGKFTATDDNVFVFQRTVQITASGPTTYKLRFTTGNSTTVTVVNNSGGNYANPPGNSSISWNKIGGYLPIVGTSAVYAFGQAAGNDWVTGSVLQTLPAYPIGSNMPANLPASNRINLVATGQSGMVIGATVITASVGGRFNVAFNASLGSDNTGEATHLELYKNGATLVASTLSRHGSEAGNQNYQTFALVGQVDLVPGDILDFRAAARNAPGSQVRVLAYQFSVTQIGAAPTTQFAGATAVSSGAAGYIPAPQAGDQAKALLGNGTWGLVGTSNTRQDITAGSSATVANGTSRVYINPAAELPSLAITMAAAPADGEKVSITFGGSIAASASVVAAFSVLANAGQMIYGNLTAPANPRGGDVISYTYDATGTRWVRSI